MEQENREAEREKLDHEILLREKAADEHRSKRLRQHAKTPAEVEALSTPIPPAQPHLSPTPATPVHEATPVEDSPLYTDLGESLLFWPKLMVMYFQYPTFLPPNSEVDFGVENCIMLKAVTCLPCASVKFANFDTKISTSHTSLCNPRHLCLHHFNGQPYQLFCGRLIVMS